MNTMSGNLLFAVLAIMVPSQVLAADAKKNTGAEPTIVKCEVCTRTTDSNGLRVTNCREVPCNKMAAAKVAPSVPVGSACTLRRGNLAAQAGTVTADRVCKPVRAMKLAQ